MTGRGATAVAAGIAVVLAAVSGALINELHGGWPWWVAAGAVVLAGAGLSGWLAWRAPGKAGGDQLAEGAVKAGRDIDGPIEVMVSGVGDPHHEVVPGDGDRLGPGAVKAGRDIHGAVRTKINAPPERPTPPS